MLSKCMYLYILLSNGNNKISLLILFSKFKLTFDLILLSNKKKSIDENEKIHKNLLWRNLSTNKCILLLTYVNAFW